MQLWVLPLGAMLLATSTSVECMRLLIMCSSTLLRRLWLQWAFVTLVVVATIGKTLLTLHTPDMLRSSSVACLRFTLALTPPSGSGFRMLKLLPVCMVDSLLARNIRP